MTLLSNYQKITPEARYQALRKLALLKTTLSQQYYTLQRYCRWYLGREKYARRRSSKLLEYIVFTHRTPLLRKLKDVEMWLQYNKIINLRLAIERLDGVVIRPGETFSYWKLIGRPTRRKGYVDGMVLVNGKVTTGVGGGLCQLSNLIYWMALHTPLTVTERYRHNFDVFPDADRRLPFGSGATCFYNYIDLQIYNGTAQPYQLHLYLTAAELAGEWRTDQQPAYRYRVYQKDHWITSEYPAGYVRHNTIYREVRDRDGNLIADELITANHAIMMYRPLLPDSPASS